MTATFEADRPTAQPHCVCAVVSDQVLYNRLHVLHQLFPRQSTASQNYNLRPRKHDKELPEKKQLI